MRTKLYCAGVIILLFFALGYAGYTIYRLFTISSFEVEYDSQQPAHIRWTVSQFGNRITSVVWLENPSTEIVNIEYELVVTDMVANINRVSGNMPVRLAPGDWYRDENKFNLDATTKQVLLINGEVVADSIIEP